MASDLVTLIVEQHCIIKFLVKEKMKSAEIHKLNVQHGKETLSWASVYDWYINFSEGGKEVSSLYSDNRFT
jgi:hypothetical protein